QHGPNPAKLQDYTECAALALRSRRQRADKPGLGYREVRSSAWHHQPDAADQPAACRAVSRGAVSEPSSCLAGCRICGTLVRRGYALRISAIFLRLASIEMNRKQKMIAMK